MIQEKTLNLIIEEILQGYTSRTEYRMHFRNFSVWISHGTVGIDICAPHTNHEMVVLSWRQKRKVYNATLRAGEQELIKNIFKTRKK